VSNNQALKKKLKIFWLSICAFLVFMTVVVGGITRLTGSGLSIVEWQPVAGILPPLSEEDWLGLFDQYRESPQYELQNKGMSLDYFKFIFFWEYLHRIMGRLVGIALLLPLLVFSRWLSRAEILKYSLLVLLCGVQGFMGWYMVKSGLVDIPRVSHLRLGAHLSLALILLSIIVWHIFELLFREKIESLKSEISLRKAYQLFYFGIFTFIVLIFQFLWGAFTAGLKAGYIYNSFPLMSGFLIPPDLFIFDGVLKNLTSNPITVQFIHRIFGWLLLLVAFCWYYLRTDSPRFIKVLILLFSASILVQFSLGVATLLTGVNIVLGVTHQGMGAIVVVLFTALFWAVSKIRKIS